MPRPERLVENLNAALHGIFAEDENSYFLGEDLADPYGGAFKAGKGLSTKYPDRVFSTPLSENGFLGVAGGLALTGNTAVVEVMFGDFAFLAFDQLCNFAAKSVSMYGSRLPLRLIVRCPVGGHRGYGPTHSQSVQKHFMGVPGLALYEMTPFHDSADVFARMLEREEPCLHFEDKTLYGGRRWLEGTDEVFEFGFAGEGGEYGTARPRVGTDDVDCLLITTGGTAPLALQAARRLLLDAEIVCRIAVPSRLYPLDLDPVAGMLAAAERIVVVEESTGGGTWGADVAHEIYRRMWGSVRDRVRLVHSRSSVIPAAAHLERDVLVQAEDIEQAVREAMNSRSAAADR